MGVTSIRAQGNDLCVCMFCKDKAKKKEVTAGEKKRENREEFAFTASLFKAPPPHLPAGREGM